MTKFAIEASQATKKAASKQFKLPTKTVNDGIWYAVVQDFIHGSQKLSSPVFKTEMIQDVCKTVKPEPWLHTTVIGIYCPYTRKADRVSKNRSINAMERNVYAVTYVWDTREIVDVQKLNNTVVNKLLELRKKRKFLAPDNHEPLKGIDKVTKLIQRDYEQYLRAEDDSNADFSSWRRQSVAQVLKQVGEDLSNGHLVPLNEIMKHRQLKVTLFREQDDGSYKQEWVQTAKGHFEMNDWQNGCAFVPDAGQPELRDTFYEHVNGNGALFYGKVNVDKGVRYIIVRELL